MMKLSRALRNLRFLLFEHVLLPPGVMAFRLLMRSWRAEGPDPAIIRQLAGQPRIIVLTCHGMLLHLPRFSRIAAEHGRRFVVMLSPSRDGRLLAAALQRLGVGHVRGTTRSRGVAGALELIERVKAGDVVVIAVDGPRGPNCVVQPGVLRLAAAAGAQVVLAVTSAGRGLTFGSWDRAHLPAPFARVQITLHLLPPPLMEKGAGALAFVQETLVAAGRALRSPVFPPP
ncbi:MAG: DUF374 domain-containing protein [Deltaproteobacteria bacterium]|nr:DUF374 domain-containing protein [Deltaproteobacteria bacterium]